MLDRCCIHRHIFQTQECIVMYLCSEGSFGLRRSCTEVQRPTFWLCRGFIQTRESHRKSHRKMTTHILSTFFGLVACRRLSFSEGAPPGVLGGLLSKTAVSEAISGSIPAAVPTAAWRETWLGPAKHNSRKYIATREISLRGEKYAVFTMCYANAHAAIVQSTCTELTRGPWATGSV